MKSASRKFSALFLVFGLALLYQPSVRAGEYTDKSYHEAGEVHTYKHPKQGSFTSPFDYGAHAMIHAAPAPTGKCNCFTFDATKSYDVDRQKLSTHWDFGDGTTSDDAVVQHCFEKAGEYKVTLLVKDASGLPCDSGVATTTVSANFPPQAVVDNVTACLGQAVTLDASKSTASGPATYRWDFGDGQTGEGVKATHSYEKPGVYRVLLTVDDGKNTSCSVAQASATAQVVDVVSVSLKGTESACVGRNLSFDAQGTGASKYHWDFGDGATWDGGSRANHAYSKPGAYTVTVNADNGQGFPCSTAASSMKVNISAPPIANTGENLVCCVGKETAFDASKSSDPSGGKLSYHWDFGDGQSSDQMKVTHAYQKNGVYRIVLTVKSDSSEECNMAMDSYTATVHAQPEAIIEVR